MGLRPIREPRPGDPIRARDIGWVLRQMLKGIRSGPGIRISRGVAGEFTISNTRRGGVGKELCPKWRFLATGDSVPELQIKNPGTIGGEMPEYTTDSLDLEPPPVITIPAGSGIYIVWLKFEWEPDVIPDGSDYALGEGGTLVEPIEIVVTSIGAPPTNQEPAIDTSTGGVTDNGIYHRRLGKLERDGASGPLINLVSDHCFSMDYSICGNRVVLGTAA